MGWFGNTPKLNRYQALTDICTVEKKLFTVSIECDALIYKTEERDGKNCLDLRVVNKEQTDISELEVCESSKVLDISNPVLDTDRKVPMHMVFEYTYLPPLSYGISDISMELMEDKVVSEVVSSLNRESVIIENIRFQEIIDSDKKGYEYFESDNRIEGLKYGTIKFVKVFLKDLIVSNGNIQIKFTLNVDGVLRELILEKPEILYFSKSNTEDIVKISNMNLDILNRNASYDINFFYIPEDAIINEDSIKSSCIQPEDFNNILCSMYLNGDLDDYILDQSIEEYIQRSFDKLILSVLVANE